ncbi:hypothetical protein MHYP_G00360220 [Metynnis hypsauchen]
MSQDGYDVISIEELNRGERVEMVVDIYESADTVRGHDPNILMEDTNSKRKPDIHNTGLTDRQEQQASHSEQPKEKEASLMGRGCYLAARGGAVT